MGSLLSINGYLLIFRIPFFHLDCLDGIDCYPISAGQPAGALRGGMRNGKNPTRTDNFCLCSRCLGNSPFDWRVIPAIAGVSRHAQPGSPRMDLVGYACHANLPHRGGTVPARLGPRALRRSAFASSRTEHCFKSCRGNCPLQPTDHHDQFSILDSTTAYHGFLSGVCLGAILDGRTLRP